MAKADDPHNGTMEELAEGNPLAFAALVHLRKELSKVSEIRLTTLDFEAWSSADSAGVLFNLDKETGDIILRHVSERSDA